MLQLTETLLPVAPGRGTLHAVSDGCPVWHPAPGAPQASEARYEPEGTLYESDTAAAIVVGWRLGFDDFEVLPERVEALEKTLLAALAARGEQLRLFVPGDTTTDRNAAIQGSYVLGRAVVVVEANDYEPGAIDRNAIAEALAGLPKLDAEFWREALAFAGGVEQPEGPATYLLSWGPLCYGAVYVGVEAERDAEHKYKFIANQDMQQEWSSSGVDGVYVESVEFTDISAIELGDDRFGAVEGLDGAGFWLICRYD